MVTVKMVKEHIIAIHNGIIMTRSYKCIPDTFPFIALAVLTVLGTEVDDIIASLLLDIGNLSLGLGI